jgi:ABC-2 type transport system permease protein
MTTLAAPASLPWLIWNDIRIKARGREGRVGRFVAIGVLALLPLVGGALAAWHVRAAPMMPVAALGQLSAALAGLLLVLISSAFAHVLRMGRDRGELELLLTAPIPAARVIAARISGVQAVVALPFLLLTLPFFVASALFGHGWWLAGPVVVAAFAVIATAAALVLATALDRLLGPVRAKTAAQLAGVLLGGGVFALGQTPNFAPAWFDVPAGTATLSFPCPFASQCCANIST